MQPNNQDPREFFPTPLPRATGWGCLAFIVVLFALEAAIRVFGPQLIRARDSDRHFSPSDVRAVNVTLRVAAFAAAVGAAGVIRRLSGHRAPAIPPHLTSGPPRAAATPSPAYGLRRLRSSPASPSAAFQNAIELKRTHTTEPGIGAFAAIIVCIGLVGGVLAGLGSLFVTQWRQGVFNGCLGSFLALLALLLGSALIQVPKVLRSLLHPRPRMTLASADVFPGGGGRFRWEFQGRLNLLKSVVVRLEGREAAESTQDTENVVETRVFLAANVANAASDPDVGVGVGEFAIPSDTMHSFASAHNSVRWLLVTHAFFTDGQSAAHEFAFEVFAPPNGAAPHVVSTSVEMDRTRGNSNHE